MGAELSLLTLDWKVKKDKNGMMESPERGFRRACEEINQRIDKLKKMPVGNDMSDISGSAWSCDDPPIDEDSGKEVTLAVYKQHLHDLVADLQRGWDNRDTTWFKIGDRWVFATGGMSYGDSPGDTYSLLNKLYTAGVV